MSSFKERLDNANNYSADEFIKRISESDIYFKFGSRDKQTIVKGNIAFTTKNYSKKHLTLINVIFEGLVSFSSLHLRSGLVFQNCDFKSPVSIEDCNSSKEIDRMSALENYTLAFSDCKISSLFVGVSKFENGISIQGSEFEKSQVGKISFQEVEINSSLSIRHCHLNSSFDFFGGVVKSMGIHFTSVQIDNSERISPKVCSNIYFEGKDSIFKEFLNISGTKYDSIVFNSGTFKDEVTIQDNSISGFLSFLGAEFESEVNVSFDKTNMDTFHVKEVHVLDTKFKNGLQFTGNGITYEKIQVNFSEKSSGVIDFRNTFFKEVTLKGNNFNNSLFFRDCSYDKLTLTHLFNKSLISFNNNNPELSDGVPKELLIQNSNLGNTEFYDFDFSIYPSIRVIDSRLDNIFVNGIEWFESGLLNVDENEKDEKKILSQKREIFRQIKLAAEKQSDRVTALEFKSREIHTHKLYIKSKRGDNGNYFFSKPITFCKKLIQAGLEKWNLPKHYIRTIGYLKYQSDRISINLGETNDHGQNWIKPLLWIFAITTATYPFLFILADPEINFWPEFSVSGWNLFWSKVSEHAAVCPQLFNPTRRVSDLFEKIENPFRFYSLDGIHRIFLAFFIFQVVSAFRKFVK